MAGTGQVLGLTPELGIIVLSDSKAVGLGMKQAVISGHGRTKYLVEEINEVVRHTRMGLGIRYGWVKAHVRIQSNECADRMAKAGCRESLLPHITEGGVCAMWTDLRGRERSRSGSGMGRVVSRNRRAALRYTHLRVGKGDLGQWIRVLGASEHLCRLCGTKEEPWDHLVFVC